VTQTQAEKRLEQLRKERCTCEAEALAVIEHRAGCPYRIAAFINLELRPYAGQLYQMPVAA